MGHERPEGSGQEWDYLPNTDGAPAEAVLSALRTCAAAWEPGARLLGNIRSCDLVRAVDTLEERSYLEHSGSLEELPEHLPGSWPGLYNPDALLRLSRHLKALGERARQSLDTSEAAPLLEAARILEHLGQAISVRALAQAAAPTPGTPSGSHKPRL